MMQNYLRSDQLSIIPCEWRFFRISKVGKGFKQITRVTSRTREPPEMRWTLERYTDHLGTIIWTFTGVLCIAEMRCIAWFRLLRLVHCSIPRCTRFNQSGMLTGGEGY